MTKHRTWLPINRSLTLGKKKDENIYIHKEVCVCVCVCVYMHITYNIRT